MNQTNNSVTYNLRNMLSTSCVRLIEMEINGMDGIDLIHASLGVVRLKVHDDSQVQILEEKLESLGFPVVQDPEVILVEQAKSAAIELIWFANNSNSLIRNSDYISDKLLQPYDKISRLFSKHTGITLEKFILQLKIEKTKELLESKEYTLSEISFVLGYSSVQYLSRQFKQITGHTVSEFLEDHSVAPRIAVEELL